MSPNTPHLHQYAQHHKTNHQEQRSIPSTHTSSYSTYTKPKRKLASVPSTIAFDHSIPISLFIHSYPTYKEAEQKRGMSSLASAKGRRGESSVILEVFGREEEGLLRMAPAAADFRHRQRFWWYPSSPATTRLKELVVWCLVSKRWWWRRLDVLRSPPSYASRGAGKYWASWPAVVAGGDFVGAVAVGVVRWRANPQTLGRRERKERE